MDHAEHGCPKRAVWFVPDHDQCYTPRMRCVALAVVLFVVAACPAPPPPVAPSTLTPTEVVVAGKTAIDRWREAYEKRDADALGKLYAQDLDLVVVVDGTAHLGWSAVKTMLAERIKNSAEIYIRLKDTTVISLAPDVATAHATLARETKAAAGATTVTETGTLTLVLRRIGADWVIAVEHYSYKRST